ncbi:putative RNA-binding protein (DUF448 domain) [Campylobacter blaseri]|uniref:YlxR domain-containing protein n=1 Tax=Campylobacter blaseri TaxID=2042961 RepID=A0A2P8QZA7_9BACT|nr:DUF448 domain-containing protein [Campylobacter blaseri]PSM51575.1 hypothetical protein CQ405_07205 [Campylobacter blaseri]PSM53368.1 hypothetical protein CRN67_07210 [Campylobacter blaseri]QKF86663.1 putative RNA-binding protein (DUF448 domain) [Campylobacter blaseri]
MNKKNYPVRTCIICKGKFEQKKLYRFKINNFNAIKNDSGRSFYLCDLCIKENDKILKKSISKFIKNINLEKLKESVLDGRCSNK